MLCITRDLIHALRRPAVEQRADYAARVLGARHFADALKRRAQSVGERSISFLRRSPRGQGGLRDVPRVCGDEVADAPDHAGIERASLFLDLERGLIGREGESRVGSRGTGPAAISVSHRQALLAPVHVRVGYLVDEPVVDRGVHAVPPTGGSSSRISTEFTSSMFIPRDDFAGWHVPITRQVTLGVSMGPALHFFATASLTGAVCCRTKPDLCVWALCLATVAHNGRHSHPSTPRQGHRCVPGHFGQPLKGRRPAIAVHASTIPVRASHARLGEPGGEPGVSQARPASTGATVTRMTTRSVTAQGTAAPAVRVDGVRRGGGLVLLGAFDAAGPNGTAAGVAPVGLVIADGQPLARAGFPALLDREADIAVLGEAGDAVALARRTRPAVLLMDIALPGLDGVPAMPRIAADHGLAGVRIVI
jgi:hypothetical protein